MATCFAVSCSEFDDSDIWDKLNEHDFRIAYLEEQCKKMNVDITNLQTIVTALETEDYIVSASPLMGGEGYNLVFKSGKSIVIFNGKDGADGKDGIDGKDGVTPTISVMKDVDGIYYWTINGEWLLINGEKVKASAIDGEDGADGKNGVDGKDGINGKDGVTPQLKIENNYWCISYDNGETWETLGKATGSDGLNGADGDAMFKKVYVEDGYVCFELNDDVNTIIRIPLMKDGTLQIVLETAGTLSEVLTDEETRVTTSLVIKGRINENDMKHVQIMNSLHTLDLSEAYYEVNWNNKSSNFEINPYREMAVNKSLVTLVLPRESETLNFDLSYCLSLRQIIISSSKAYFTSSDKETGYSSKMTLSDNIKKVEFAEGVVNLDNYNSYLPSKEFININEVVYPSTVVNIPFSIIPLIEAIKETSGRYNYYTYTFPCEKLVCKAITPPTINDASKYEYDVVNKYYMYTGKNNNGLQYTNVYKLNIADGIVLYVPRESIELYKAAPLWEKFTDIRAIEDMQ